MTFHMEAKVRRMVLKIVKDLKIVRVLKIVTLDQGRIQIQTVKVKTEEKPHELIIELIVCRVYLVMCLCWPAELLLDLPVAMTMLLWFPW